jgi:hypothetical protein
LWRVTLLIIGFIVICTAVVGLPRVQPLQPLLSDEIKRCGEQICVRNVIIDKTTLGEAMRLLSGDPDVMVSQNANTVTASTRYGTLIFASSASRTADQFMVANIETYDANRTAADIAYLPLLGDFIIRYGPPCKVRLFLLPGMVILYYPTMYLRLVKDDGSQLYGSASLTPFIRVGSTISYNDENFCTFVNPSVDRPWKGFQAPID